MLKEDFSPNFERSHNSVIITVVRSNNENGLQETSIRRKNSGRGYLITTIWKKKNNK